MVVSAQSRGVIALIIVSFSGVVLLLYSKVHPSSPSTNVTSDSVNHIFVGASTTSSSTPPPISTMTSTTPPTFTLSNNITIPSIGLGSASGVAYPHILHAIEVGYRFIDTAQSSRWGYRESDVGLAVHEAKLRYEDWIVTSSPSSSNGEGGSKERDYVFVQTKIHPEDLGYHSTKQALQLSLERLHVTTLDSVLIHKPHCWEGICAHEPEGTWHDAWEVLQEAMDDGIVRAIGMCDVDERLLGQMLSKRIGPMVIQNWFDPFHQDKAFRQTLDDYNRQNPPNKQILYQGYSTLGSQWFHHKGYTQNPVLHSPILQNIASKYGAMVPQVVIQWATRQGVMVLPASTNPSHQESNLDSYFFTLSEEEMQIINDMDGNLPQPENASQKDKHPDEVAMEFVNHVDGVVDVYWVPPTNEGDGGIDDETSHVHVGKMNGMGDVLRLTSYHGHAFVFKDGGSAVNEIVESSTGRKMLNMHVVDKLLGSEQQHEIDDRSDEEL